MPVSITQYLGLDKSAFDATGALDAILDVDTRLFIDPSLLRSTSAPELGASANRVEERFVNILRLLAQSRETGDVWERRAEQAMHFPEVKGICIGYSSRGTAGSGIGPALRRKLLNDAREIVQVGVHDPEMFDLAGLFEDGIGPDRISDMVAGIIQIDLILYTKRVFRDLGVSTEDDKLVINPYNNHPIILVPRDVLRDLPLALDWSEIALVSSHNENLRREVNELVGSTWRKAATASKRDVFHVFLKYPDVLRDLIDQYRKRDRLQYDFADDRAGQVIWHPASREAAAKYPLPLSIPEKPSIDDISAVVNAVCEKFREMVEDHGWWKLLYDKSGHAKHEEAAQLLFFGLANAYCEANDLAISPESDGGRGPVDFKFAAGYELSVIVEVKLSRNKALKQGFTKQLPTYMRAERSLRGVYLVVDNGASARTMQSFTKLVSDSRSSNLSVRYVDGKPRPSASKQ